MQIGHIEVAFFAKRVHVFGQAFCGDGGNHFVDHLIHVGVFVAFESGRHRVGAQEGGLDGDYACFSQAFGHTQHLELGFEVESVPALDFNGSGTHANHRFEAFQGRVVQVVLGHAAELGGAVEDATAAFRNLLIGQAFDTVFELAFARCGKHKMGVGIHPQRDHRTARNIPFLIGVEPTKLQLLHGAIGLHLPVGNRHPGVLQYGQMIHRSAEADLRTSFADLDEVAHVQEQSSGWLHWPQRTKFKDRLNRVSCAPPCPPFWPRCCLA